MKESLLKHSFVGFGSYLRCTGSYLEERRRYKTCGRRNRKLGYSHLRATRSGIMANTQSIT
jgi:hypothetical protein